MKSHDALTTAISGRIWTLRRRARRSMKQAARVIGVCAATYNKIENGQRALKPAEAAAYAEYYHVDVRFILSGISPKECEVVEVMRKPEVPTLAASSVPSVGAFRSPFAFRNPFAAGVRRSG